MAKDFMQDGKWIENPAHATVLHCSCGSKYIQTRKEQKVCLRCHFGLEK